MARSRSRSTLRQPSKSSSAGDGGQGQDTPPSKPPCKPETAIIDNTDAGSDKEGPPAVEMPPPMYLTGPTQSPRDPNLYQVVRLGNGIRMAFNTICSFHVDEVAECERKLSAKTKKERTRSKAGNRSKCTRTHSDYDTPSKKRSRANDGHDVKDINCIDQRVMDFNKAILHICETSADGCYNTNPGFFTFTCCGLYDAEGNRSVEGDGKPVPTPEDLVTNPEEPPAEIKPSEGEGAKKEEGDEEDGKKKKPVEYEHNEWNRLDPAESGDKYVDCSKMNAGKDFQCSMAVTVPWGPLFDPDDCPGASQLLAHCLQACTGVCPRINEQSLTFVKYFQSEAIGETVKCLTDLFHPPEVYKHKEEMLLKFYQGGESYEERLRKMCWTGHGITKNPKLIKFLSTLAKLDHPIRRCGLGGRNNRLMSEISCQSIDRAFDLVLKNNIKPEYITVAAVAPIRPREMADRMIGSFTTIGDANAAAANGPHAALRVDGDPDPFDTPEFHKIYKILPCPEAGCDQKCDEHYIILSFPLPPEAWTNYKTRPLGYLSYIIGYKGIGSLYHHLRTKSWMEYMHCQCPETSLHRNQFVSLFQISIKLTDLGFKHYEEVLQATFAYLKYLIINGPQRHIFKDIQRVQAIEFHALRKQLVDVKFHRNSYTLSEALQIAVSRDIIMANNQTIEYNGPLLKEYMEQFTPQNANIMIVSSQFNPATMTEEEPFLKTKYSCSDIGDELMSKLTGASVSEFSMPERNDFIPNSFCVRNPNLKPDANPIHITGDDFHDLWHLKDSSFGTNVGIAIHFAVRVCMKDIKSAAKLALFHAMFEHLADAYLYPAAITHATHEIQKTEYGIFVSCTTNWDKVARMVQALAHLLSNFQNHVSEDYFDTQRQFFRQKLCCRLKKPAQLERDLNRVISISSAWPLSDYVTAIEELTRDEFFHFLNQVRHELYFMLLVAGNATVEDAEEMSNSILEVVEPKPITSKIEPVRSMQWPVGYTFIKVDGLDCENDRNYVTVRYQIGLATGENVMMATMIQYPLQSFIRDSPDLADEEFFLLVGISVLHNVVEMHFQAFSSTDDKLDPENVQRVIEDLLVDFDKELCTLTPAKLCQWKKRYLCCCNPKCYSLWSLKFWSRGVLNLNMESASNAILQTACKNIKVQDVQEWVHKFLTYDESDCCSEARIVTIGIMGHEPAPSKPQNEEEEKCAARPKRGCCTTKPCEEISLDLVFQNPYAPHCDALGNVKEGVKPTDTRYIVDLEEFKADLYIYPTSTQR